MKYAKRSPTQESTITTIKRRENTMWQASQGLQGHSPTQEMAIRTENTRKRRSSPSLQNNNSTGRHSATKKGRIRVHSTVNSEPIPPSCQSRNLTDVLGACAVPNRPWTRPSNTWHDVYCPWTIERSIESPVRTKIDGPRTQYKDISTDSVQ